ncbi:DUF4230 domain-containing protein [Roseovarius confluentis]|uniref:DUF4230 domain-containing protein n=1 Tax=Roseovarius confluentis TaxID=1852027 RepID=UPI001475D42A|nr:DUF4230 domain-containing protein [Roseovarius confluentis]
MASKLRWYGLSVCAIALGACGALAFNAVFGPPTYSGAAQLIRSETVAKLTTQRIVTNSIVTRDDSETFLGEDQTLAYGTVTLSYGIDLELAKLIRNESAPGGFDVKLPELQLLSAEIDEDTVVVDRDATGLSRLLKSSNSEIESQIRTALKLEADKFIRTNGGLPSQNEMEQWVKTLLLDIGYDHTMIDELDRAS